jgi:hypothetical protein
LGKSGVSDVRPSALLGYGIGVLAIEGHVTRDGRGTVGWGQDRRGVNTKTRHPAEHRVPYTLTAAKEALICVRSKDRASTRGTSSEKPTATFQAFTEGQWLFFV